MSQHKELIIRTEMDLELRDLFDTEFEARQYVGVNEMVIPLYGIFRIKTQRLLPEPPRVTSERTNEL